MTVAAAQDPKKARRKRGPRVFVDCSRLEHKAVRAVAKHEGYLQGALLRRHSLNEIVQLYHQLSTGK